MSKDEKYSLKVNTVPTSVGICHKIECVQGYPSIPTACIYVDNNDSDPWRDNALYLAQLFSRSPTMQALLERWVKELDDCVVAANIKPIYDDTKQLLKEAKEVKDD